MGVLQHVAERFRSEPVERPYECLQCGAHHDVEYYTCPACGSFSVDRRAVYR